MNNDCEVQCFMTGKPCEKLKGQSSIDGDGVNGD